MRALWLAIILAGCGTARSFTVTTPSGTINQASDGIITVSYEYPLCLIPDVKKEQVKIEARPVKQGFWLNILDVAATAAGAVSGFSN